MKSNKEIGQIGEDAAVLFLEQLGYNILERNWRFSRAEIDIIAKDHDILVFVEVKTRSYNYYGEPEDFINERKEHLLSDAASQYMNLIKYDWEIRFDIISILILKNQELQIKHFKDAWF